MPHFRLLRPALLVSSLLVGFASCLPTNDALDEKVVDWPTVPAPHIAHLRGRVVDFTTGQPIAGAKVDIGAASTISGPDGSYALGDLRIEAGDLETTKVGYDTARTLIPLTGGEYAFNPRLRPATPIAP